MRSAPVRIGSDRATALAWALVLVLLAAAAWNLLVGSVLWAAFGAATAALLLVPAVAERTASATVPWEIALLAVVPFVARSAGLFVRPATYLSVAAVALTVAVEFHGFTAVEMNDRFAVVFVATTTMAAAGLWTIAQYASDRYLGTTLLTGPNAVMWDLVAATVAGIAAGILFGLYFDGPSPDRVGFDGTGGA